MVNEFGLRGVDCILNEPIIFRQKNAWRRTTGNNLSCTYIYHFSRSPCVCRYSYCREKSSKDGKEKERDRDKERDKEGGKDRDKDKDEDILRVYDGNAAFKKRQYRNAAVGRNQPISAGVVSRLEKK